MHSPILEVRRLAWPDEPACAACAQSLAARAAIADAFIELSGPLGAGKTTFARHLLRALGIAGRIKSPTYALIEPYTLPNGGTVSHCDFYRFDRPQDWLDAGLREVFAAPGLKLVEWPERAGGQLPVPDLSLMIAPQLDGGRIVQAHALSPRGLDLLA